MEILSPGIAVFKNFFLRGEEVIDMTEESGKWRAGTAGKTVNPKVRITDIHDLETTTELHGEILQCFIDGINEYSKKYPACRITSGEPLRVGRYGVGGHYALHSDSNGASRVLSGILYLNDDYVGGELRFEDQDIIIKPEEGMLVLFPSNFMYLHESLPLTEGSKYIGLGWFK